MNLYEKIKKVIDSQIIQPRIKAELRFANNLSELMEGKFNSDIEKATDYLLTCVDNNSFTKEDLEKTEQMLMPIAPLAKEYKLYVVSHAHIDMNWMWGIQETNNIVLDTFRTMLKLMDEYPDFTFSQSQASTYKMAEELDPDLFAAIKNRVKEGRWEVSASTWTEGDKNIACAEAQSRQFLYTKQYMKEKFGIQEDDLCIDFEPDTFGHSAFEPEILQNAGVKYLYHCRGGELAYAYRYKAPSGDEILCWQDPYFYNFPIDENTFERLTSFNKLRGLKIGITVYGVGDHGGGPSRRDIERILDMQTWPIAPVIEFGTYKKFFAELENYRDSLPVIDKERNFIFTGCYSSQSRIKAANRFSEDRLYTSEAMSGLALVYAKGKSYNYNFKKAWENVLFNNFHDILPGSCVRDTREYALGLYQQALGYANAGMTKGMLDIVAQIDTSSVDALEDMQTTSEGAGVGFSSAIHERAMHTVSEYGQGKTRVIHVFNMTGSVRTEVVELTIWDWTGDVSLLQVKDIKGNDIEFAAGRMEDYWSHRFFKIEVLITVPAFGFTTVVVNEKEMDSIPVGHAEIGNFGARIETYEPNVVENEFIKARFDSDMCLVSLIDKETGEEKIRDKAAYLEYYYENARIHMPNAWTEGPPIYIKNINEEGKVLVVDPVDKNALHQRINYTIEFMNDTFTVSVSLNKGSRYLRFGVISDWHQDGKNVHSSPTVRFKVPLAYETNEYLYDIPFGMINREDKMHDVPAHYFAYAPCKTGKGIALFHDTQISFRGHENTLSTPLFRSTTWPDDYPEYGRHDDQIGIAILPADKMVLHRTAESFTHPMPFASVRPHKGELSSEFGFMTIDGDVIVTTIKTPENNTSNELIIRFYSIKEEKQTVKFNLAGNVLEACVVDTLEREKGSLKVENNAVTVDVEPLKAMAIRVKISK